MFYIDFIVLISYTKHIHESKGGKMEKEYKLSWGKIVGILALIIIIVAIIFIVYPKDSKEKGVTSNYINNINLMKEAGFEYFKGNNLPDKIGESNRITLDEMVSSNLVLDFKDDKGNLCNKEESYIKVTKSLEDEYSMKVFLSCDSNADYIVTTIIDKDCPDCNIINTNKEDDNKDVVINDNKTNSKPKYSSSSNNYYSKPNNIVNNSNNNVTYNINYVNNCNNCSGSNCNNCTNKLYHTVSFITNGGTEVEPQIIAHGSTANYYPTSRVGYEFLGWYLDGEKYDFSTPVTKKITLIAKWQEKDKEKSSYDVCFVTSGGTKIACQDVDEGDRAYRPNDPSRTCYTFMGWYINSSLTKKYDFSTPVYSDITLYAKWEYNEACREESKYTVRFNSNGGSSISSQEVYEGERAYKPSDPKRSGYTFRGWYYNGYEFDFTKRIYQDYTLTAMWEKEEEKYNTYCKVNTERYYSTSYVKGDQSMWNYNWTIKFDGIKSDDLKIVKTGYLTSTSLYNEAYNRFNAQRISMVGSNNNPKYVIPLTSGSMLKTYSLKSNNFDKYLSTPYKNGDTWYMKATVNIRNYSNATKFYASNINDEIYLVPFYFDVEYTDRYNCVDDKASNAYKYSNYKVVNSYYRY